MDQKYAGDPDSPNFLPPSPLIDRQVLSAQVEGELKRSCAAALASEQSSDSDLALVARYLAKKPSQGRKPQQHDKHSSFTFQPPKSSVPELATSSFLRSSSKLQSEVHTQLTRDRQEAVTAILFEPIEPANKKGSRQKPGFTKTEDQALDDIRSQLDSRPKTSAAACIDYTESISPVHSHPTASAPSNQTTNSTPFTSAPISPGRTSKRFSRSISNTIATLEVQSIEITALPECPDDAAALGSEQTARARSLTGEQQARRQRSLTQLFHHPSSTKPLHDQYPVQPRLLSEQPRHISRTGSIRNSISNGIREYIRPGSLSGTVRSNRSTSSTPSRTGQPFSALRARFSSASLRSQGSGRTWPKCDDGVECFIDPKRVDLDRPLPPLPGLHSYKEKPKHIGLMMKSIILPPVPNRATKNVVIDNDGVERVMTVDEEKQRQEDLARAVMEKMSTGSIGSVPTSPTGVITVYRQGVRLSINGDSKRPVTAGSGMGVGAVPLFKACQGPGQSHPEHAGQPSHPGNPSAIGVFVKKWGERLGWGRKTKVVSII